MAGDVTLFFCHAPSACVSISGPNPLDNLVYIQFNLNKEVIFNEEKEFFFLVYKCQIYESHMGGKYQKLLKPSEVRLVIGDILKRDSSRKLYIKPLNENFLLDELCAHSKY